MAAIEAIAEKNDGQEPEKTVADAKVGAVVGCTEPTASHTQVKTEGGGRKRKRHIFNAIRGQMEFYFGDANLSKDRFLRRYVEQDPCKYTYISLDNFVIVVVCRRAAGNISNVQQNQDTHTGCAANIDIAVQFTDAGIRRDWTQGSP